MTKTPIRERLLHDLAEGDLTPGKGQAPVDRIGALARASRLGSAIKRLQVEVRGVTVNNAVLELHRALWQGYPRSRAMDSQARANLCRIVVMEMAQPHCRTCTGRGTTKDRESGRLVPCPACAGAAVHRYSDSEREAAFGRALTPDESTVLQQAITLYSRHAAFVDVTVADQLYGDG